MAPPKLAPQRIAATAAKVAVASLVVGLVLSIFNITPEELLADFGGTIQAIFDFVVSAIEWAVPYVVLGAVIVVPVWLVTLGLRYLRGRRP